MGMIGLVTAALFAFHLDWTRTHAGIVAVFLGILLLVASTIASSQSDAPAAVVLGPGVVMSVGLGWWGYKAHRRGPREPLGETLLAMLAAPVPSARRLRPVDVLGTWRFYVNAATSTVTVRLEADGRYTQAILGNRGERVNCPGGTWTLAGPYLDLSSYHSAMRKVTGRARWFFGDWQKDLVLFAKDDPDSPTMWLGQKSI